MKPKVCIFDVDGTLSRGFYIIKFSEALYKEGMFSQIDLSAMRDIFSEYKAMTDYPYEQFARELVNAFGRGIRGTRQKEVEDAGKRYIALHPEEKFNFTEGLVQLVKAKGYRTAIISGSPSEIILPFSISLGIDDTFATSYRAESGIFIGEAIQNCAVNRTKKYIVEEYVQKHDIDLQSSAGFGDSHHDVAFLEMVGHPIALNPNPKLEEIARERNWLVCHEKDDVLDSVREYLN